MSLYNFDNYLLTKVCDNLLLVGESNTYSLKAFGKIAKRFANFVYGTYAKLRTKCFFCLKSCIIYQYDIHTTEQWRLIKHCHIDSSKRLKVNVCSLFIWKCSLCCASWCKNFKKNTCFDCKQSDICGLCMTKCRKCNASICNQHRDNICGTKRCNKKKQSEIEFPPEILITNGVLLVLHKKKCQTSVCNAVVFYKNVTSKGWRSKKKVKKKVKYCNLCKKKRKQKQKTNSI